MGRKSKGKSSGQSSSSGPLVALVVAGAALFAGLKFFRPFSDQEEDLLEDAEAVDDKAFSVRSALFDANGEPSFAKGGSGKGTTRFGEASYWEERYAKTSNDYDWYGTWSSESAIRIKEFVPTILPSNTASILNLGCGNSRFAEELKDDGFKLIMNVDIANSVIEKMTAKFAHEPSLKFQQMDATAMSFADNTFDAIFEKGTLDAMYTGSHDLVKGAVKEVSRVLRPGGTFVSITFGHPKSRRELNETSMSQGWSSFDTFVARKQDGLRVSLEEAARQQKEQEQEFYYIYVMKK